MRVLMADKLASVARETLVAEGHEVVEDASLSGESLAEALAEHAPDVLVVRSTRVDASHLAASSSLSLVVRAGAGVNTIDLAGAGTHGVFVSNCPGKNADAVAELTLGLLVALDRRIPDNVIAARDGRFDKATFSKAEGLAGRTLGLLGFGQIGQGVARRARACGMRVIAWSRSLTDEVAAAHGVTRVATPIEVASAADVLSLHLALTPETRGLVDATLLDAMRDGAALINTAREGLVDEAALLDALDRKGLWAALDVFDGEPAGKSGLLETPLAKHAQVYLTHHIGASTTQAQVAVALEVVRVVRAYDATGAPPNCVNLVRSSAAHVLVVRHRDRVGVLASVLDCLRRADVNVKEMENTIFQGEEAAVARILISHDVGALLDELLALDHVLHAACVPARRGGAR